MIELVPKRRLELLQAFAHQTLNLARLPVPPLRRYKRVYTKEAHCQDAGCAERKTAHGRERFLERVALKK
jgi:hypothetical protein